MARMRALQLTALCFGLITLFQFYFTMSSKPTGFSLKLIPRDSPDSPLYPGNLTYLERMERLIKFSEARGYYLENFSRPNATIEPAEVLKLPTNRADLFYFVTTAIGSQSIPLYLLLDTGSGAIWTQCKNCKTCFDQHSPMYDFRTSTSYRRLDCKHPFCSGENPLYLCIEGLCFYRYTYTGGSTTIGFAGVEKFLFTVHDTRGVFIDGIIFGCAIENRYFEFSKNGIISGILGLDRSPNSLISQLADDVDYRFSYCLAPFSELLQQNSFLRFGDDIPPPPKNVQTTRFVTIPGLHNYYLNLLDISVGDARLGFTPDQFKVRKDGSGGFVIDSGTIISRIDRTVIGERNAYDAVMSIFRVYYDSRNLQRIPHKDLGLELCYKYPPGFKDFATMTFHFAEADYHVEGQHVHVPGDESLGYFCVALMHGNGTSYLGAWHQQNMRITYDGKIDELQFAPEYCLDEI